MRACLMICTLLAVAACSQERDPDRVPTRLVATGAEPFFRLELNEQGFRLTQPDYPDLTAPAVPGRVAEGGFAYETGPFQVIVLDRTCETSSGETLPYAVDVMLTAAGVEMLGADAPDVLTGCGEPG